MSRKENVLLEHVVAQGEGNIVSDMGGEKVILSVQNSKYYNLGEIGGIIWDRIKEPVAINQVIATLTSEYDVKLSQCEEQVLSFLKHLSDEGLIEVKEETSSLIK